MKMKMEMALDEAILHCEEVANRCDNRECASEHRQLAEWLKELKERRRVTDDYISRQAAIDALRYAQHRFTVADEAGGIGTVKWSEDVIYFAAAERILTELPSAQPEPCGDAVSRNAIIQKLNTMDRYVSEELILCDTDKKFPKNEVFIVNDVYEEIVENLPSAEPEKRTEKRTETHGVCLDAIDRQAAIDALDVLCQEHRYKIPGKSETYSQYNEAWQDALDRAEGAIFNLPSAQLDLSGYSRRLWKAAYERGKAEAQPEIIHCGECKYYDDSDGCFFSTATTGANGFCHWAERKEGEADGAD